MNRIVLLMQALSHSKRPLPAVLRKLVPDFYAPTVHEIDFKHLREKGITAVAVDIDNTLVPHGGLELTEETVAFFRQQRDNGNITRLAIATNRSHKRIVDLSNTMHADVAFHAKGLVRKPGKKYFADLLSSLQSTPGQTAMVGDKVIQDIYGGNAAGLTTILVDPLGPALWFERFLFRFVQR